MLILNTLLIAAFATMSSAVSEDRNEIRAEERDQKTVYWVRTDSDYCRPRPAPRPTPTCRCSWESIECCNGTFPDTGGAW